MFSLIADTLLTLIYPQHCGACGRLVEKAADGAACRECWNATKIFDRSSHLCVKCGLYLVDSAAALEPMCKHCADHFYDSARSVGIYERALTASVLDLKMTPRISRTVRRHFIDSFNRGEFPAEFTVIPVPLSKKRSIERGFNQAALLAKVISNHADQPLDEHSLVREKDTPMHRAAMDRKAREATVRNAFNVIRPALIEGRNILLVDDLMTSGSTASYCGKALKKSGAARVDVLTLARAV